MQNNSNIENDATRRFDRDIKDEKRKLDDVVYRTKSIEAQCKSAESQNKLAEEKMLKFKIDFERAQGDFERAQKEYTKEKTELDRHNELRKEIEARLVDLEKRRVAEISYLEREARTHR